MAKALPRFLLDKERKKGKRQPSFFEWKLSQKNHTTKGSAKLNPKH
jgi:hypothetical protein